ncbi:hypothetical protein ACKWTF_008588 [Chironomus riparius]
MLLMTQKIFFHFFLSSFSASPSDNKVQEQRKKPTCSMCTNHGKSSLKKKHKCFYDNEEHLNDCNKCKSTKNRRLLVAEDIKKYRMSENLTRLATDLHPGRQRLQQLCRRCKIHRKEVPMNNHRRFCEFKLCNCVGCKNIENRCKEVNNEAKSKRGDDNKPKQQPKTRQRQPKGRQRQPKIQTSNYIELPPFEQNFSQLIQQNNFQYEVECQQTQQEMNSVDLNLSIQSLFNYPILREGINSTLYELYDANNQERQNEANLSYNISYVNQQDSFSTFDIQYQDSSFISNDILVDQIEVDVNTWINQNCISYSVEEIKAVVAKQCVAAH